MTRREIIMQTVSIVLIVISLIWFTYSYS